MERENMNIVIVGHVDHGKSTVIGRMLADTGALPKGKLEQVKEKCKRESREFEYAFLLDALKDEQSQGITIDSARCFFKSKKRDYIIIDAPGHIEFLKNMISGAARAEAALLVIDADEGIQENSKRHGYMLSMLGIDQVVVCVNKMDLVDYDKNVFEKIRQEYTGFLKKINIIPKTFVPVSALKGDNIVTDSENLSWFKGKSVIEALDSFEKEQPDHKKPFRMPVQDVYKFTKQGDNRRIVAGRIESGSINVGDKVIFLPSNKRSTIKSIEGFNLPNQETISVGYSTGFTLAEQIYINRGELMCKENELLPKTSSMFRANIFWMGKQPMQLNKEYILKIHTARATVKLKEIKNVLDASELDSSKKDIIERHEVADCIFETVSPLSFDLVGDMKSTSRFVIVDNYDIAGGGIIAESREDTESQVRQQVFLREKKWDHGLINFNDRALTYGQKPSLILLTGPSGTDKKGSAKILEKMLFESGRKVYFLGIGNLLRGLDSDIDKEKREEHIRRLGEVSNILIDAGLIVIATASDLNEDELKILQTINTKNNMFIVNCGSKILDCNMIDQDINPEDTSEANALKILGMLKFKNLMFSL